MFLRLIAMTEITRAVCSGNFFTAPPHEKARSLWQSGIYDAGVEFYVTQKQLNQVTAKTLAASLAHSGAHSGDYPGIRSFAFGDCPDITNPKNSNKPASWLALFPAKHPAKVLKNGEVFVPMDSRCPNLFAHHAAKTGAIKKLATSKMNQWQLPTTDGIVSVTCSHDKSENPLRPSPASPQGPELWYTIPTGNGPDTTVPHHKSLTNLDGSPKNTRGENLLLNWINELRQSMAVPTLNRITIRGQSALVETQSQLHNRKILRTIAATAYKEKLQIIGEDRALGSNLEEVAWLLWNSPRHRDLLLNPRATHALIEMKDKAEPKKQILASLILFHQEPSSGHKP